MKQYSILTTRSEAPPAVDNMNYRTISIRKDSDGLPSTWDNDTRSVEVVGATEAPVEVYDYQRMEIVKEVLLMSGCEMPKTRQVPLLDTHRRYAGTVSVLGSYREMVVEGDQLVGRSYFSSAPEAESPATKTREGHLTDFSAGYRPIESEWVPAGETKKIRGRSFEGPVKVTTRWRIRELSICPIGADEDSTARTEPTPQTQEIDIMNEKLRKLLEARGLPQDATDDEAWEFFMRVGVTVPGTPAQPGTAAGDNPDNGDVDVDAERTAAATAERERVVEINAVCGRFNCTDLAEGFINGNTGIDEVRRQVMDRLTGEAGDQPEVGHRSPVGLIADEADKFRDAARDALLIRSDIAVEQPAAGADDLTGYSLRELARHALMVANRPTNGDSLAMVGRALTTSDFPYLLANVANRALFVGWDEADETWQQWCGTGSVSDFKTHNSPRVSEVSDLEEVPEDGEYKYGKRTEAQESYAIATYGKIFPFSRQAIINDDLGALTGKPKQFGEAAARKVGDLPYAVLTANAAMGDAVALFHASHSNLGSAGAVALATIKEAITNMKLQKDLQGLRRLNIKPQFFIAPATIEGDAEVFFNSFQYADEAAAGTPDEAFSTTRKNPYAGSYFTRVYESRLDDDSTTAYYFAAAKGKTIVIYFLNGQKKPRLETKQGWTVDGVEWKVAIDAGAKAMDWRGLSKNAGA